MDSTAAEWSIYQKLADDKKVAISVGKYEAQFVKGCRLLLANYSDSTLFQKSKTYFSVFFNKDKENAERDIYFFHVLNDKINFNFNILAENIFMKKIVGSILPRVLHNFVFRIAFKEDYLSPEVFLKMQQNNFAISDDYFPTNIKSHPLIYFSNIKAEDKKNLLKIKLVHNQKIEVIEFMTVSSLIPAPSNIIIFVTGGGFISDMEKVAQIWLRKSIY